MVGIWNALTIALPEMVTRGYFAHCSSDGESFANRLIRFGYSPSGCTGWAVARTSLTAMSPAAP